MSKDRNVSSTHKETFPRLSNNSTHHQKEENAFAIERLGHLVNINERVVQSSVSCVGVGDPFCEN